MKCNGLFNIFKIYIKMDNNITNNCTYRTIVKLGTTKYLYLAQRFIFVVLFQGPLSSP